MLPLIPATLLGSSLLSAIAYGVVIFLFDCSTMLYFMPYLALRLKLTPDAYLGRMVSTMRFLTVAGAPIGALSAGWIAEHFGLRNGLATVAAGGVMLTMAMFLAFSVAHHPRLIFRICLAGHPLWPSIYVARAQKNQAHQKKAVD
ncbi:hypothetical protein ACFS07_29285 [Undibacterium arcticum]